MHRTPAEVYPVLRALLAARVLTGRAPDWLSPTGEPQEHDLRALCVEDLDAVPSAILWLSAAFALDPETASVIELCDPDASRGTLPAALALRVFSGGAAGLDRLLTLLGPDGELAQRGLVSVAGASASGRGLLATPRGVRLLLGNAPPARPAVDATMLAQVILAPEVRSLVGDVCAAAALDPAPRLVLALTGGVGTGKTALALAMAAAMGRTATRLSAAEWGELGDKPAAVEAVLARVADQGAVLVIDDCELAIGRGAGRHGASAALRDRLSAHEGIVVFVAASPELIDERFDRLVHVRIHLDAPTASMRAALWSALASDVPQLDAEALGRTLELTGAQIANAAHASRVLGRGTLDAARLEQIAALQLHRVSETRTRDLRLDSLVLPPDTRLQLEAIVLAARNRAKVLDTWGFGRRLSTGLGISALFHGEPGTGKTLAARCVASELSLPVLQVNVAQILDKYVGETEKNLERVFRQARASGSMLVFDEADALFSARVQVEHSMDRSANLEVNLLLQLMEHFDGIAVLTTNLKAGIDQAFERRIGYKVYFPFPSEELREDIWRHLFPPEAPLSRKVDFYELANRFELSGGSIQNAVLRAAYAAAAAGRSIDQAALEAAAEAECAAAGKLVHSRGGVSRDPFGI
jgi:SpoVK/Ycf46/Vps4 family AAA+-type ATPase